MKPSRSALFQATTWSSSTLRTAACSFAGSPTANSNNHGRSIMGQTSNPSRGMSGSESRGSPPLQFLLDRLRRGGALLVDQLGGQLQRRAIRPARAMDRLLAIDAALLGLVMPAVGIDEMVARDMAQPEMERHRRLTQIFL